MENERKQQFLYAMQLANSTAVPMVLNATIQLGIFDMVAKAGPNAQLSPLEIATKLSATAKNPEAADMVDRMLRLLTTYSLFTCSLISTTNGSQRVYGISPMSKYFVSDKHGASLGPWLALNQDKVLTASWFELKDAVLEGGTPFDRDHGVNLFEYAAQNQMFNEAFNKSMLKKTTIVINEMLESYKGFNNLKSLVDVGGGVGVSLQMIISKYPTIRGINFDLPHVIENALFHQGVEHVGGDMFEGVPSGEAILMQCVLHDWNDDKCVKLLKTCQRALPENGKVIVVEIVVPETPDTSTASKTACECDLHMMAHTPGGKERTELEFLSLAKEAGFKGIRLECSVCGYFIMEFYN